MKVKRSLFGRLTLAAAVGTLLLGASSCNSKEEASSSDISQPSSLAAITSFKLKALPKVASKLDSVFFSIDLNKGVVFNADSLPLGTSVEKLIPVITYSESASAVTITQTGGNRATGDIDYKKNPNDTVDFSGKVTLTITAQDETTKRTYDLKVNVHRTEPDSLMWDQLAVTSLPSRLGQPMAQKTVRALDGVWSLIQETDGTFTMTRALDLIEGTWQSTDDADYASRMGFVPQVRTLTGDGSQMAVLSTDGSLYTTSDPTGAWTAAGPRWENITGYYDGVLTGIRRDGDKLVHTYWPESEEFTETPLEADFPTSGFSNMVSFSNRWTTKPIVIMAGGRTADGSLTDKAWGFDGDNWAVLSENMLPPIEGAAMVPYHVYRKTSSSLVQTEFAVWMLIGGRLANDSFSDVIYTSYDNGVNWYAADTQMQLPDYMPGLAELDGVTENWEKRASLSANWRKTPSRRMSPWARVKYEIDDYEIYWDCPYIYLFGGTDAYGRLNDEVWRGVLARLTFTPLF